MKNTLVKYLGLCSVLIGLIGFQPVNASIITPASPIQSTAGSEVYDGNATTTNDLIYNAGTKTFTNAGGGNVTWTNTGSGTLASETVTNPTVYNNPGAYNDGVANANLGVNAAYLVNEGFPGTLIFNLNVNSATGGNARGYSISEIRSIGGWNDSNDASQDFTVYITTTTNNTFTQLGGLFSDELPPADFGSPNSTYIDIQDTTGILADNVTAIKFVYTNPSTSNSTILHELDVLGTFSTTGAAVPEPSTYALLIGGLAALVAVRARRGYGA